MNENSMPYPRNAVAWVPYRRDQFSYIWLTELPIRLVATLWAYLQSVKRGEQRLIQARLSIMSKARQAEFIFIYTSGTVEVCP
jgi:hypothetical protein